MIDLISKTFMYLELASNSLQALQSSKPMSVLIKFSSLMVLKLVRDVMRFTACTSSSNGAVVTKVQVLKVL